MIEKVYSTCILCVKILDNNFHMSIISKVVQQRGGENECQQSESAKTKA